MTLEKEDSEISTSIQNNIRQTEQTEIKIEPFEPTNNLTNRTEKEDLETSTLIQNNIQKTEMEIETFESTSNPTNRTKKQLTK